MSDVQDIVAYAGAVSSCNKSTNDLLFTVALTSFPQRGIDVLTEIDIPVAHSYYH